MIDISKRVKIDMLEKMPDGTYTHKLPSTNIDAMQDLRLSVDKKLEYYDGTEWVEVKGGGYPVNIVKNVTAVDISPGEVLLNWQDPDDVVIDGITVAKWKTTKVMRKVGEYPKHEEDGELVVSSGVRNQYETTPYVDRGLSNNTEYFYAMFPKTEDEIITLSESSRTSLTPIGADDITGSPGGRYLIAGDMNAGFFGETSADELFTGVEISNECGVAQGVLQFSKEPWLKFAIDGKIVFKSKKAYKHSVTQKHLYDLNLVFGETIINKNGINYKVRLMEGLLVGDVKKSEWNRLMLPIHIRAKTQNWRHSKNVSIPTEYWGVDYTDADLGTNKAENGSAQWCQEMNGLTLGHHRGYEGVSHSFYDNNNTLFEGFGWSPVLEVAE